MNRGSRLACRATGAIVSIAVPYFLFTIGNLELEDPYTKAVALYCLAAFLSSFRTFLHTSSAAFTFSAQTLDGNGCNSARSLVTFYFTYAATSTAVPLAFAYGQLMYSLCVLLIYALPQLRFAEIGVRLALGKQHLQWGTLALVGTFSTQVSGTSLIIWLIWFMSRVADERTTSISGFVETRASRERERGSYLARKRRLTRRVRPGFIFGFAFREDYSAAIRSK